MIICTTFALMLLVIESSADYPSVCVVDRSGTVVFERRNDTEKSHAEKLPLLVEQARVFIEVQNEKIEAVALNEGPGSYTGLRIGTSLAKGLCFGLQVPLISVNGLEAMGVWALKEFPQINKAIAMIDARRDEVYVQRIFREGNNSKIEAEIINDKWEIDPENDLFIGNANEKAVRILQSAEMTQVLGPYAEQLALVAYTKWQAQEFESVAYFEPFYLKEFQAGISKKFAL
jgi:tRNA threonylcarbamoyladenosine biosynthesis protein TsaB